MAINKNALIRYKVLDNCFRNSGKRYFIDDLIAECNKVLETMDPDSNGISRRQIFDDITFMESAEGWSIELERLKDGKRIFYRYADASFSINNMPLNETEIAQLKSAVGVLSQFKGMPQFEWIHEMVPKLQQGAGIKDAHDTIIEFDSNQYLKGIENLGLLHDAILYNKVLRIAYHPYESDAPIQLTIHPYYLKQYNNRWFLFGYNPDKEMYDWNLALDRIVEVKEIKGKFQKNSKIDWKEYFDDLIGVTRLQNSPIENVTLHFLGKTGKYMESKPIHGSQKSKWIEKDILEVKLSVILNYELERLILSYADQVKVMSPKKLQLQIAKRLAAAFMFYNK